MRSFSNFFRFMLFLCLMSLFALVSAPHLAAWAKSEAVMSVRQTGQPADETNGHSQARLTGTNPQILIPLYNYPNWYDSDNYIWDDVAAANSQVPITAIINPCNGPVMKPECDVNVQPGDPANEHPNSDYQRGLSDLRSASVTILGYVDTNYGKRSLSEVKAEVHLYDQNFNIHGIFFNQAASGADKLSYYQELYNYVESRPNLDKVIINPGTHTNEGYINPRASDTAVIFGGTSNQNQWVNYQPDAYVANYSADRFAMLVHGVPNVATMQSHIDLAIERNIGYVYLTDDIPDNEWDTLPSFWQEELNYIAGLQKQTPTPTATSTTIPSATPTASAIPTSTSTSTTIPSATSTASAIPTPIPTNTTIPSATPTASAIPTPTATSTTIPSATPTASAIPTSTATSTIIPSATPTASAIPTPTATSTTIPSATPTASTIPTPTATSTTIPSATPTTISGSGNGLYLPLILLPSSGDGGSDENGPMIEILAPRDRQSVYTQQPIIDISYSDFDSSVNTGSLVVQVVPENGTSTNVTSDLTVTESGAQGTVSTALADDTTYTLTVSLADNAGDRSRTSISFYVPPDPENITPPEAPEDAGWVSGVIYDSATCNEHLTECQGVAGVQVTMELVDTQALAQVRAAREQEIEARWMANRSRFTPLDPMRETDFTMPISGTIITGPDGFFAFPVTETGHYWLRAEKDGYTYGQREAEVVLERSAATNSIYLTPLDSAVTPCDNKGCLHTSSDGLLQVEIPAGAIPTGETVDVTATNFEQVEYLPSGDLPEGTWETYAFNLGGDSEYQFRRGTQATIRIKNTRGFAPGTSIPLGYWNQATQDWEHAGTGIVDATGEWIKTDVTHFSNYDCNDPITPGSSGGEPQDNSDDGGGGNGSGNGGGDDPDPTPSPTPDPCDNEGGCVIDLKTGTLGEDIALPTVNILGEATAPTLLYNTNRANPSEIIDIALTLNPDSTIEFGNHIGFELHIEGEAIDHFFFSANLQSGEVGRYRYMWDGRDAQGNLLPPGVYRYEVKLTVPYRAQYCYALNGIFGNPPDCENGATGVFTDAGEEFSTHGTIELESHPEGPFGTGWVLEGQQRLYEDEAGRILIADGQRNDEFYFPSKNLLSNERWPAQQTSDNILAWVNSENNTLQTISESVVRKREWKNIEINLENSPHSIAPSLDGARAYVTNIDNDSVSVIELATRQEIATISVGSSPYGIEVSPDEALAYVTNSQGTTVSVVDLVSLQEVTIIDVGREPRGIALSSDGAFAYVTNYYDATVSVIDLDSQQQVATINLMRGGPEDIALSPDGALAYVTKSHDNTVSVIDLESQQQVATINVGFRPMGIALSLDGALAYVANSGNKTVSVVELASQQEVTTIDVGYGPGKIVLSPDGASAYVTNYNSNTVSVVDLANQQEVTTMSIGQEPVDIALSPDGALAYVTSYTFEDKIVSVLDLASQLEVTTTSVGDSPSDIALSPYGAFAYVTNLVDNNMSVVDLASQQQVTTIPVGNKPQGIALSLDGAFAYVTNRDDATLSVVDLAIQQQVATIDVGAEPQDVALSPDGAFAYVTNYRSNTVSVVDLASQQEVATIPVVFGPYKIALSSDGAKAYVTSALSSIVSEVNLVNQQQPVITAVGLFPHGIALSPDDAFAYVANSLDDTISVVQLTDIREVATIDVGDEPEGIALSPDGVFAYVTNSSDNTVSVVDLTTRQAVATIYAENNPIGIAVSDASVVLTPTIYSRTETNYSTLTYDQATTTYTRTYPDGTEVHFNSDGTHDYTLMPDGRKSIYTYHPDGSVATMGIIPPGESTPRWAWTFNYTSGQLDRITDPAGRVTDLTVNAHGHLSEVEYPDDSTRRFVYDQRGLLTEQVDENGDLSAYAYDDYGRLTTHTAPPHAVYNPETGESEMVSVVRHFTNSDTSYPLINDSVRGDPDNPAPPLPLSDELVVGVEYGRGQRSGQTNKWGSFLSHTDSLGRTITYERDEANNVTRRAAPDGDCTEYTYDDLGNVLSETQMDATQCGLSFAARDPSELQTWTYTYSERFNHIKTATNPLGNTTTYFYDYEDASAVGEAGKLIRVEYPPVEDESGQLVTPSVSLTYNQWGLIETETDMRGTVTKYVYTQGTPDEASDGSNPLFAPGVTPVPGLLTQVVKDYGDDSHLNLTTIYKDFDAQGNAQTVVDARGNPTHYTFDPLGRRLTQENALGYVTKYTYDEWGNLIRRAVDYTPDGVTGRNVVTEYSYDAHNQRLSGRTAADGLVVQSSYTYDINRQLTKEQDAQGNETIYLYDDADQLVNVIDPAGHVMTTTYTLDGQIERVIDPAGSVARYVYDEFGRLVEEIQDEGELNLTTSYTYDLNNNLLTMTAPDGTVTCYIYDALNRRTSETRDCGGLNLTTTYTINVAGDVMATQNERGIVTQNSHDALGRMISTRQDANGLNLTTTYSYDEANNLISTTDERGIVTTFRYDTLNRQTTVTQDANGLSLTTTYRYDRLNNLSTITDPNDIATLTEYNAFGQPIRQVEDFATLRRPSAREAETTYTYDNNLNLIAITDDNSHQTKYRYNERNELTQTRYADGTTINLAHNSDSTLASRTDQAGDTVTFAYDGAKRLISKSYPDNANQTFAYDAANRLTNASQTMSGHTSHNTFAYNALSDVINSTQTVDSLSWTVGYDYDYTVGETTITYPSGTTVVQELDTLYRLGQVQQDEATVATYTYNDTAGTINLANANGVTTLIESDPLRRVTRINSALSANDPFADYRYGYDGAGNRTHMQRYHKPNQPADVYEYDGLYQLSQVWYGADRTDPDTITAQQLLQTYQLDTLGNRLTVQNNGTTQTYLPSNGQHLTNPMNRYEQVDSNPFSYDTKGNLLADGRNTYTYDYDNRQIGMSGSGHTAEYVYDALERRVAKVVDGVTTYYVYNNRYQVLEERDGSNALAARYVYGVYIDEPLTMERSGVTYTYHHDAQFSITEMTDSNGTVVERYEYDVYGEARVFDGADNPLTTSAIGNLYLYTGRRYDPESGNYYFRARMYASRLGRFLQPDPEGYVDGMNLYQYVGSSPTTKVDPWGLFALTADVHGEYTIAAGPTPIPGVGWRIKINVDTEVYRCCNKNKMENWFTASISISAEIVGGGDFKGKEKAPNSRGSKYRDQSTKQFSQGPTKGNKSSSRSAGGRHASCPSKKGCQGFAQFTITGEVGILGYGAIVQFVMEIYPKFGDETYYIKQTSNTIVAASLSIAVQGGIRCHANVNDALNLF